MLAYFSFIELLRSGLFIGCLAATYLLSARWCISRLFHRTSVNARAGFLLSGQAGGVLLTLAVIGMACCVYGVFIEPRHLRVTEYRIETPKIRKGEKVRVVHLADLHVRGKGPRETQLPDLVRSLKPDLILHSGDFFARAGDTAAIVTELLRSWNAPQYACEGNMDYLADFQGVLRGAGVKVLDCELAEETVRGAKIRLFGCSAGTEWRLTEALNRLSPDAFTIVLCHAPHAFPRIWHTPADLMLSGHTHGGQICLPWYGAVITLDEFGKRYESGLIEENGAKLVVSRGIGCVAALPEMRFLCPPEVVVIDLIGTGE